MRNYHLAAVLLVGAALLSACGEFAYKRGAQLADLELDRDACHAVEKAGLGYEQCMANRGWTLQNLDEEPLMATVGISTDNRATAASAGAAPDGRATSVTESVTKPFPAGEAAVKAATQSADPLDQIKVGSWWKLGGNSAALEASIDTCVATLGDAHRPDASKQLITRGLLRCLRDKGWYGVANR